MVDADDLKDPDLNHSQTGEEGRNPGSEPETWVLQGDAAARTGFSVSAIRKWRRMGVVAERKVGTGDLARVQVRLEDVFARAALQPQRQPLPTPAQEVSTPRGTLIIGIEDLEAIFERMVRAERRAEVAEAEVETMQVQARDTWGQMAELRRLLQAYECPPSGGAPPPPAPAVDCPPASDRSFGFEATPTNWHPTRSVSAGAPGTRDLSVHRTRTSTGDRRPPESRVTATTELSDVSAPRRVLRPRTDGPDVDVLATRLRDLYARLDRYRRQQSVSASQERQRQRELAEYDRTLLALCEGLGMGSALQKGMRVSVDDRARLTRALAQAGFDVRAGAEPGSSGSRWSPRRQGS